MQFLANGSIFVLLGEQIPSLIAAAPQTVQMTEHQNPSWLGVLAAGVIGIVLILATLALPHALRGLDLPDESPHHQAAEDQARLLAAETADAYRYAIAAAKLVDRYRQRIDRYGGADDAALRSENDEIERQLRLVGLRAERGEILRIGRSRGIDDTRLRKIVRELDLQEARYGG